MNTNALKKFARSARTKLMEQVAGKLEIVLNSDSAALREQSQKLRKLREAIDQSSKELIIEKVAYIWFNRLMALRFMDANDYQPGGSRIVTPLPGEMQPEILTAAKSGMLPDDLQVNRARINDLLDRKIPSNDPETEVYKALLVGACNQLARIFPFLFERIDDYAELLLPDDLLSEFSIVRDIRDGMTDEDCEEVEIIGWLYQFYISEWNEDLISSKKKYDKNELAPASQLFTPKWIVQYMVDNTLGQVWSEINPNTKVTESLEFYIKPAYKEQLKPRAFKSIEEVKFFEPCMGSGHILSYAFDVFYKIYEEQGYSPSEIPELIITKNLFGVDIDPRAAQLASFVLMMKGRQKYRRFFRTIEKKQIKANIAFYQDYPFDEKFNNATALGSLIQIEPEEALNFKGEKNNLFAERDEKLELLYKILGQRYDVVVTNPPYISSSRMEASLKTYVETKYPQTKTDLFATFILRCLELCNENGLTGFMTPFVWMFISSYEKLRREMIEKHFINNLIQLEYSGFDGATVPVCTFTLRKKPIYNAKGSYIRLSNFKGSQNQAPKTIEAVRNPDCGWFYTANQIDFEKIPGNPIGYWLSENIFNIFESSKGIGSYIEFKSGMSTTNNNRFLKLWQEVEYQKVNFSAYNLKDAKKSKHKWFPYIKGGGFRKWYGNKDFVLNWLNDGEEIKEAVTNNPSDPDTTHWSRRIYGTDNFFVPNISWSRITSSNFSCRFCNTGSIISDASNGAFSKDRDKLLLTLMFLNSKIANYLLKVISPTLNFHAGEIKKLPYKKIEKIDFFEKLALILVNTAEEEWNSKEVAWDFQKNELLRHRGQDLEESYDLYCQYWKNKFFQLHKNEEELNRQFIDIYGLQEELTPDVPLEDITILKTETTIDNGKLVFNRKEVMAQLVSYAVGCMFGRYALDKEGLVLANQGESLEDFLTKIEKSEQDTSFVPDDDNIIPVLDAEWFEDDIVGRFHEFLKVAFGEQDFKKNLLFIEDALGKDIRKYFIKDFYKDHIKRYKKRPIYWMFSSPKDSFNALIYLHRYTPDTLSNILNNYLLEYREKLNTRLQNLEHLKNEGTAAEQLKSTKEIDKIKLLLLELQEYEREVLYPLAAERIALDLDDGVLVNYNKFGNAIKEVKGLNDKKTKQKVRGFDWIEVETIRD